MSDLRGLDKIIAQIEKEAEEKAAALTAAANEEAEKILSGARGEAAALTAAAEKKAGKDSEAYAEQRRGTDEQLRKAALLRVRNEIIDGVVSEAFEQVLALDDEAYFAMIRKLFAERAAAGEGVLCLNARDLARCPSGLAGQLAQTAADKGGSVRISEDPAGIRGGFILAYGDIEENCSLEAIFSARKDEFRDRVNELLFR